MELTILNQTLAFDAAPMHIAPGGSLLCRIVGNARRIAKLLARLREEIAYGISSAATIDAGSQAVSVDIYFGKADEPDFRIVFSNFGEGLSAETNELPQDHVQTGLTMAARNRIIDLLAADK